ncbi:SH3 domain-containing protein, partial [Candidatus Pelagibacter sp.]|nr:SH3 domain-containing protein [Candidatus Pelagibacter sp.]
VIAIQNKILFKKPSSFSKPIAKIEKGRLLIVDKCQEKWCKIKSDDYEGWIKTNDIWGLIN